MKFATSKKKLNSFCSIVYWKSNGYFEELSFSLFLFMFCSVLFFLKKKKKRKGKNGNWLLYSKQIKTQRISSLKEHNLQTADMEKDHVIRNINPIRFLPTPP